MLPLSTSFYRICSYFLVGKFNDKKTTIKKPNTVRFLVNLLRFSFKSNSGFLRELDKLPVFKKFLNFVFSKTKSGLCDKLRNYHYYY